MDNVDNFAKNYIFPRFFWNLVWISWKLLFPHFRHYFTFLCTLSMPSFSHFLQNPRFFPIYFHNVWTNTFACQISFVEPWNILSKPADSAKKTALKKIFFSAAVPFYVSGPVWSVAWFLPITEPWLLLRLFGIYL